MQNRGPRSLSIGIIFSLLVFSGCDGLKGCAKKSVDYSLEKTNQVLNQAEKSLGDEKDKSQKPVDADFVIEGEKVFYKGKLLPVLGRIEEWIAILGDKVRQNDHRSKEEFSDGRPYVSSERITYIWDELGVTCLCTKDIVGQFKIVFRKYEEKDLQDIIENIWPKKCYEKDILIDGVVINKGTPISKFNHKKSGPKFTEGYFPTVYDYDLPFGENKSVYVQIKLTSKKEVVSFSLGWQRY